MLIAEDEYIDSIRIVQERYEQQHGIAPYDLSHWDPGVSFIKQIEQFLRPPPFEHPLDYLYGSELPDVEQIAARFNIAGAAIGITPSATASQLLVASMLRALGLKRVRLVTPHYFAAFYALDLVGLQVIRCPLTFEHGNFFLNPELITTENAHEAIWITDPVFTVGVPHRAADEAVLRNAIQRGSWLVIDQALARPGEGLHQRLGESERTISIHSPHKSINVNGLKFGAVALEPRYLRLLDHWSDIVIGGLPCSACSAINHFLSADFDRALDVAVRFSIEARAFMEMAATDVPEAKWSRMERGIFGSFFFPRINPHWADDMSTYRSIVESTGASFIPGSRNQMPAALGFSFRVNVTRDSPQGRGAVKRLLHHVALFGSCS